MKEGLTSKEWEVVLVLIPSVGGQAIELGPSANW